MVLDKSVVAQVTKRFAEQFGARLTKKGLGKFVPGIGIVLGSGMNWATLEKIIDVADNEYRRRFLLEKYPFLTDSEAPVPIPDAGQDPADDADDADDADEVFSVLDELAEAGGPNIG
ncbi:EcsC family protein [Arthrobacter alpinus]|nr:EcsC family protein [Arthrobacter alpinus]